MERERSKDLIRENASYSSEITAMDREKQELRLAENRFQSMTQGVEEAATLARVRAEDASEA